MTIFNDPTPERKAELRAETDAKLRADREADEQRAADMEWLRANHVERVETPHFEIETTCRSCGTALVVEVPQPYCDSCK